MRPSEGRVAAHVRPALTTFNLDLEAMGLRLGRIVIAKLSGETAPMQELVPAPMIVRQSDCPGGDSDEA